MMGTGPTGMPTVVLGEAGLGSLVDLVYQTGGGIALGVDASKNPDAIENLVTGFYAPITAPYRLRLSGEGLNSFAELKVELNKNDKNMFGHVALAYPKYLKPCVTR
jgi:hypothetical protein